MIDLVAWNMEIEKNLVKVAYRQQTKGLCLERTNLITKWLWDEAVYTPQVIIPSPLGLQQASNLLIVIITGDALIQYAYPISSDNRLLFV